MALFPAVIRSELGRLGNQIFQYSALRSEFDTVVLAGFSDLFDTFENVEAVRLPPSTWRFVKSACHGDGRLSRLLGKTVNFVEEDALTGRLAWQRRGRILLSRPEVYSQCVEPPYLRTGLCLRVRREIEKSATGFLASTGIDPRRFMAIHVRGGDYASWPTPTAPAQIPLAWVVRWAEELSRINEGVPMVVVGDDPALKNEVAWRTGAVASRESAAVDFAILSRSCGGVISASSFAWWGSAFAANRSSGQSTFIAPKYWIGHRSRTWQPPSLEASEHLRYEDVA